MLENKIKTSMYDSITLMLILLLGFRGTGESTGATTERLKMAALQVMTLSDRVS